MKYLLPFILLLGCRGESPYSAKKDNPTKETKDNTAGQIPTCEDCEHLRYELTFSQCNNKDTCNQPPHRIEAEIRMEKNKIKNCNFTEAHVCVREFGYKGKKKTEDLTHRYHTRELSRIQKKSYGSVIYWWDTPYLHPFSAGVRLYCLPDEGIYYLSHALTPPKTQVDNRETRDEQGQYYVNYRGYYINDSVQEELKRQHRINTSKTILELPQDKVFGKKLEYDPDDTCFADKN